MTNSHRKFVSLQAKLAKQSMKRLFIIGLTAIALTANAEQNKRAETFPISSVRLTDSQFLRNQQADIHYLLGLDADRLLAPYLKGAGLTPKAENYTNWENTGLDGHIGGHYVSALSYMLAATGNQESAHDWTMCSAN